MLEEGEAAGEEEEVDLRAYLRRKRGLQPPVQEGGGGQGGAEEGAGRGGAQDDGPETKRKKSAWH